MNALYFDLDDTLYDRNIPFIRAFTQLFPGADEEQALRCARACGARSVRALDDFQHGRISRDEMNIYRYRRGMEDAGVALSDRKALIFHASYLEKQRQIALSDTVKAMLDECVKGFDTVGIITNGEGAHQREKIDRLGLLHWIAPEHIFISGEQHSVKPEPRIFEIAAAASGATAESIIFAGDSYFTDICGAKPHGWKTVWLNRTGEALPPEADKPDREVHSEAELRECLKGLAE